MSDSIFHTVAIHALNCLLNRNEWSKEKLHWVRNVCCFRLYVWTDWSEILCVCVCINELKKHWKSRHLIKSPTKKIHLHFMRLIVVAAVVVIDAATFSLSISKLLCPVLLYLVFFLYFFVSFFFFLKSSHTCTHYTFCLYIVVFFRTVSEQSLSLLSQKLSHPVF